MSNPLAIVKPILAITHTRWLNLTSTLPTELLTRRPEADEWSALECLRHLYDTELLVFPVRVQVFLAGHAVIPAYNPETDGKDTSNWTAQEIASEFARLREKSLAELELVTVSDLERSALHSELGRVTLGEMLYEWGAHDFTHTIQAERALMQPFIVGSGPWRHYFSDHDVEQK